MKKLVVFVLFLFVITGSQAQTPADRKAILAILDRQTADWNAGNTAAFMNGYWKSDSLTFIGKVGITYGYDATLSNYKRRYPDQASMGTLKFTILKLEFQARNVAYVIGKFQLTRPKVGDAEGYFSLLWRKINGQWVIVSDHSS
ncbi:YybH family protein [Larkinella knui]|uniref:Nuclear transport factor 2 family protein n=1 Tax=Larkinella knui TaxID=2025310 RepID=A0A3P1CLS7_9BACT|nr:nuclear transport factor 2 family protein [Larkinella knui]RRB14140.1 nuclear transport factor 2 family protein [Larkinella knui]